MGFRLPNNDELTIEQTDIINLPPNKNWVIQGAPGTGKTVMAIFRAKQLVGKKVLYLVYNRNLSQFLSSELKKCNNCESKTWYQWLSDIWKNQCKSSLPTLAPFVPDWDEILPTLTSIGKKYDHIIVDEAQDFPEELIKILVSLSKNMTCFVDPNQEVEAGKTSSLKLIRALCEKAPYPLTTNFRNTIPIRDVSALFCMDGTPAEVKKGYGVRGDKPVLKRLNDYDEQTEYLADLCRQLYKRGHTIGIIVNNKRLNSTYESLSEELDGEMPVMMAKGAAGKEIDFDKRGVQIVSYGTMKGLEFESVILPRFEKIRTTDDHRVDMNRMYVATSRPRLNLFLTYFDSYATSKWIDNWSIVNRHTDLFDRR